MLQKFVLPVRQAPLPAHALGLVIRIAGTVMAMHWTETRLALALEGCITLISLEQRIEKGVNKTMPAMVKRDEGERYRSIFWMSPERHPVQYCKAVPCAEA